MKIHKFNPIRKRDTLFFKLLVLVGSLQAIALLIFGGVIISEIILEPETSFEAPPPPEKVEKKQQFQHKIQKQQQTSKKVVKRIQIPPSKMNNVSTAVIDLPSAATAGGGFGGVALAPKDIGEMNIAMTSVDLLGLPSKTEKIAIVIDASSYMMTDEKGALNTYNVIKNDIKRLIGSLPGTILFNVIAFTMPLDGMPLSLSMGQWMRQVKMNAFSSSGLVLASESNKSKLMDWLDPINKTLESVNTLAGNYNLKSPFLSQKPDARRDYTSNISRYYVPYQAALEQGVDTIYILTARWVDPTELRKPIAPDVLKAYQDRVEKERAAWQAKIDAREPEDPIEAAAKQAAAEANAAQIQAHNEKALAEAQAWIDSENAKRAKAGKSLYVGTAEQRVRDAGNWQRGGGKREKYGPPPPPAAQAYNVQTVVEYYKGLVKELRGDRATLPVVNMILFRGKNENIVGITRHADAWAKAHKGKIRVIVGTDL